MGKDLVVSRSIVLNTHAARVWDILTRPELTTQYMFNCAVCSDWRKGSSITWKGSYKGQDVFQKGEIIEIIPGRVLTYSTFDPHSGSEDNPGDFVIVSYTLIPLNGHTELQATLSNFNDDPVRVEHAALSWDLEVLPKLKALADAHEYEIHSTKAH